VSPEFIREKFRQWRDDMLSESDFKAALKEYSAWLRDQKQRATGENNDTTACR
jgi:hypothetical protein